MRILTIMQCTDLGGMEQAHFLLMKELKRRKHDIRLVSLHPLGALASRAPF